MWLSTPRERACSVCEANQGRVKPSRTPASCSVLLRADRRFRWNGTISSMNIHRFDLCHPSGTSTGTAETGKGKEKNTSSVLRNQTMRAEGFDGNYERVQISTTYKEFASKRGGSTWQRSQVLRERRRWRKAERFARCILLLPKARQRRSFASTKRTHRFSLVEERTKPILSFRRSVRTVPFHAKPSPSHPLEIRPYSNTSFLGSFRKISTSSRHDRWRTRVHPRRMHSMFEIQGMADPILSDSVNAEP